MSTTTTLETDPLVKATDRRRGHRFIAPKAGRVVSGRWLVLGGPGGYLATTSAEGRGRGSHTDRWPVLISVRRPMTPELRQQALGWVLRHYELVP